MNLSGPEMPVQELEALLPALGVVLPAGTSLQGGDASANLLMEGRQCTPRLHQRFRRTVCQPRLLHDWRQILEGSRQSAGKVKCSVQADVMEVRVAGDLGYCWLKLAVTVTPPDSGPPMQHAGQTIGIYRREGGRWVLARDANLVV